MKQAFTMVELIFVIVIDGILAAVAIIKLNATREDAQIATLSGRITSAMSEISAYAMSRGSMEGNVTAYSNIVAEMVEEGTAHIERAPGLTKISIQAGNTEDCVELVLSSGVSEENLSLAFNDPGDDVVCKGLKKRFADYNTTMILRGHVAKF